VGSNGKIRTLYLLIENQSNKRVVTYSYREQDTGSTPVFSTIN